MNTTQNTTKKTKKTHPTKPTTPKKQTKNKKNKPKKKKTPTTPPHPTKKQNKQDTPPRAIAERFKRKISQGNGQRDRQPHSKSVCTLGHRLGGRRPFSRTKTKKSLEEWSKWAGVRRGLQSENGNWGTDQNLVGRTCPAEFCERGGRKSDIGSWGEIFPADLSEGA